MSTLYRQRPTSEKLLEDFNTWNLEDIETIKSNDSRNMEEIVNYSINGVNIFNVFFETKFEILQIKTQQIVNNQSKFTKNNNFNNLFINQEELGSGTFGNVFKVSDHEGHGYAVKKMIIKSIHLIESI